MQYKFMAGVCKSGLNNNFFLLKSLEKIEFVAGDEDTEKEEQRLLGGIEDMMAASEPKEGDKIDLEELKKIWNTADHPVISYKNQESAPPHISDKLDIEGKKDENTGTD